MTLYRIYAKMIASRRYQVIGYIDGAGPIAAYISSIVCPGRLAVLSPRPYPKGCIINPTTVIRELIAARREA